MTIASDIIQCKMPDFDFYLRQGDTLDDIDEYGFTPLIEAIISHQPEIVQALLARKVNVNKSDVTGRTPLHWAVDNGHVEMATLLLQHGANPNAFTSSGLGVLVYPVLRGQDQLKHLLYQYGAKLDFALDFIQAKLIGHRFELAGDVDIVTADGHYIELDYEGFILEFTVAIVRDALRRFVSSFSTRHLREHFPPLYDVMDALEVSSHLLELQHRVRLSKDDSAYLDKIAQNQLVILPAASRGHAMGFVRYKEWWVKVDRGENSLKEGSINFYKITNPDAFNGPFIEQFLLKKQPRAFFHQAINNILGLRHHSRLPMTKQVVGNCSWANIQALVPATMALFELAKTETFSDVPLMIYHEWIEWDKDRSLDDIIGRYYLASPPRQASIVSVVAAVLFQSCNSEKPQDLRRAEKILPLVTDPKYAYVLKSYLDVYCIHQFTPKGNNLLKLLDDCGYNPNIGVNPIATGLKEKK